MEVPDWSSDLPAIKPALNDALYSKIEQAIKPHSDAAIKAWLKAQEVPFSAVGRPDLIRRVHDIIATEKLSFQELQDGLIGVEESAAKIIHLFTIPTDSHDVIDKQIVDLQLPVSSERKLTGRVGDKPKMIYLVNTTEETRMKWAELHTQVSFSRKTLEKSEKPIRRNVVMIANKKSGLVQIRYDKPADIHPHKVGGYSNDAAYLQFYREKFENTLGLSLKPLTFREGLRKALDRVPEVLVPLTIDVIEDDGGTNRLGHHKKGADPRKAKGWSRQKSVGVQFTCEAAPVRWAVDASGGALHRPVFTAIDAAAGQVRFDADCHESEVEYVLAQLV